MATEPTPGMGRWLQQSEDGLEKFLFNLRWILAPAYVILGLCLISLVVMTGKEFYNFILAFGTMNETKMIVEVLTIVDLVFMSNLILMVILVGYVTFVSGIALAPDADKPKWMETLDYSGLKLQVIGSIIAVSAIKLLRAFMGLFLDTPLVNERQFFWMVVLHATFLCSAVVIGIIGRLKVDIQVRETQF